jgi:hypothetical protein
MAVTAVVVSAFVPRVASFLVSGFRAFDERCSTQQNAGD